MAANSKSGNKILLFDLVRFAVLVRLGVILWTILTDLLVTNYDTSTFSPQTSHNNELFVDGGDGSKLLVIFHRLVQPFSHWDSVYFLRIAKMGFYEYEHFHAFFPLYPYCIRGCSKLLMTPLLSLVFAVSQGQQQLLQDTSLMLSGFVISNVCFVVSVIFMFHLSRQLFTERVAWNATRIYAINPASIFMSSIYTESMFAMLSLMGMYCIVRLESLEESSNASMNNYLSIGLHLCGSTVAFCLASLVRGNGIVCCGFFVYYWLLYMVKQFGRYSTISSNEMALKSFVSFFVRCSIPCCFVIGAYFAFQLYGFKLYCLPESNNHFQQQQSTTAWLAYVQNNHPWCLQNPFQLYGYIQKKYWNVGFLKYYEMKQLPNFILASPIIFLSLFGVFRYARHGLSRFFTFSLARPKVESRTFVESDRTLVFVYYWAFLTLSGLLFMHIQVLTRFLASCPPLYWYMAELLAPPRAAKQNQVKTSSIRQRAILGYIVLFVLVGPALFGNFYPWT